MVPSALSGLESVQSLPRVPPFRLHPRLNSGAASRLLSHSWSKADASSETLGQRHAAHAHSSKSVQKPPILLWRTLSVCRVETLLDARDSSVTPVQGNLRTLTDTKCRSGKLRSRATSPRPSHPLVVVPNGMPTARHVFKRLCFLKGLLRRTYSFDLGGRPSPPFFHRRRRPPDPRR